MSKWTGCNDARVKHSAKSQALAQEPSAIFRIRGSERIIDLIATFMREWLRGWAFVTRGFVPRQTSGVRNFWKPEAAL
jgi:hypothetical protein